MLLSGTEPPITVFAVSLGGLVVGALFLRDGLRWLKESFERRRGPSVLGRIISSQLVDRQSPHPDERRHRWRLHVIYEYSVRGRLFCGTRIAPGPPWFKGRWYATWQAQRYELGSQVRVYFDPAAPDRALLDPRLTVWSPWLSLLLGASCAIAGMLGLTSM